MDVTDEAVKLLENNMESKLDHYRCGPELLPE